MTPLKRWLRRTFEKAIGQWEEGAVPPPRLDEVPVLFANAYPRATRAEWAEFAQAHAREAYRAGFVRGTEYVERDPELFGNVSPDEYADAVDPHWRDSHPVDFNGARDAVVPEEPVPDRVITEEQVRLMARPRPGDD